MAHAQRKPSLPHYLTPSDYLLARGCDTRLYYRKLGLPERGSAARVPSARLRAAAAARFGGGERVDPQLPAWLAADATRRALLADAAVVYDGTFLVGRRIATADVLRHHGAVLDLLLLVDLTVPAGTSTVPSDGRGGVHDAWRDPLHELAFCTALAATAYPDIEMRPWLLAVDHSRGTVSADGVMPPEMLVAIACEELIAPTLAEVEARSLALESWLAPAPRRAPPALGVHCAGCAFRGGREVRLEANGFRQCWGARAEPVPHLLDLHGMDGLSAEEARVVQAWIARGVSALADLQDDDLHALGPAASPAHARRLEQVGAARAASAQGTLMSVTSKTSAELGGMVGGEPAAP